MHLSWLPGELRMQVLPVWSHLQTLLDQGADPNRPEPYRKALHAHLLACDARGVAQLYNQILDLRVGLCQRRLWCAASLLLGHYCSDEAFMDFRGWLIAQGPQLCAQVLADADALAAVRLPLDRKGRPRPLLQAINGTLGKVYQKLVADDEALDASIRASFEQAEVPAFEDDVHIGWQFWDSPDAAELARELPALWALHGERWSGQPALDDPDHPFAGFTRQALVPGLGKVQVGDRLLRRCDGSAFEVLGLSDLHLMFGDADGHSDFEFAEVDELRFIARIREEDGTMRCNQGLSRSSQRWPHEPAESVLPGDPQERLPEAEDEEDEALQLAWEQRDHAIQERVAAAVAGELRVIYAATEEDAQQLPIDNLDEQAFAGQIRFVEVDPLDGERFESEVLTDPSWLDLAVLANRMLQQLGYEERVYLEGFEVIRRPRDKPRVARFLLGS